MRRRARSSVAAIASISRETSAMRCSRRFRSSKRSAISRRIVSERSFVSFSSRSGKSILNLPAPWWIATPYSRQNALDWATHEATLRSWELFARYVIPEINGHTRNLKASAEYLAANKVELMTGLNAAIMAASCR